MGKTVIAKKQKKNVPQSRPSVPFGLEVPGQTAVYKPNQLEQRYIRKIDDKWAEYTLDDGSIVKLKATLIDAKRVKDSYAPDGSPLYNMQLTLVTEVAAPEALRKPEE
jgi:hypothetical protein